MPLRDHFHPPLDEQRRWQGMYAMWPPMIVLHLRGKLPVGYVAQPIMRSGEGAGSGSMDLPAQDVYEVQIYDERRRARLVAAIEIVSPANKDRPESRRAFVAKCAGLLRERISVVIVDIVTTGTANLYAELLDFIGQSPRLGSEPLYCVACRITDQADNWRLEAWEQSLSLQEALPTMPLWLADDLAIPLELEKSYEESCAALRIA